MTSPNERRPVRTKRRISIGGKSCPSSSRALGHHHLGPLTGWRQLGPAIALAHLPWWQRLAYESGHGV
eukprot:scaffold41772_cov33-Phaeocystis_antarctica.AAC.1